MLAVADANVAGVLADPNVAGLAFAELPKVAPNPCPNTFCGYAVF